MNNLTENEGRGYYNEMWGVFTIFMLTEGFDMQKPHIPM